MSEQTNPTEVTQTAAVSTEPGKPADKKPALRPISDPREVAAVVMGRMKLVKTKKDELSLAIDGLVDITQQLTRAYAEQLLTIDRLRRRVKELEPPTTETPAEPRPTLQ
ncbi:hypothetical protein EZ313_18050 [Ramlibacter henchirensis]|uniref:Uncharacterized protein n=1 Tax=Ramlibacter henchirensis TaxID=204072 RepID=A0A4Z0BYM6_9BURK|nr:hypothetical protein [Ramlibacter henchirensis]TFZ03115.1 hypothetical protein EZ313_18050 [Ramlibacter henchirensis]